jgi:Flp pilus assembly pilin Flp
MLLVSVVRDRATAAASNEDGATAIEWAIFAILALAIAGLVAGAITLAINNRLPLIN